MAHKGSGIFEAFIIFPKCKWKSPNKFDMTILTQEKTEISIHGNQHKAFISLGIQNSLSKITHLGRCIWILNDLVNILSQVFIESLKGTLIHRSEL